MTDRHADEQLDARLREAARAFASEPLPDDLLEAEPMQPGWLDRFRAAPVAAAVAVVVLGVAAVIGLNQLLPIAEKPSPSPSPVVTESPSPQPSPSPEPTVTPTPAPTAEVILNPALVVPGSACADGTAGFSFVLPDGWYANRRMGDSPACRAVGTVRVIEGRQHLDPEIYLEVAATEPEFEDVASVERRTLPDGTEVDRYVIDRPESGAIAAERVVAYVAPLIGPEGGFLLAQTDAEAEASVHALDAIMERLSVFEPLTVDPAAVAAAAALFGDLDYCIPEEHDLVLVFPDAWWTNTAFGDVPACQYYAPTAFEIADPGAVPEGVAISIGIVTDDFGFLTSPRGWETLLIAGRAATRLELDSTPVEWGGPPDTRSYHYVVQLGEAAERGPSLVASIHGEEGYELAKAVLDEMMARLTLAPPPPGASSTNPAIDAPPVSATASEGDFTLQLTVEQDRYRAGQPIFASATLTYAGPQPSITLWGSGSGIVGIGVRQLDGDIQPWGAATTDCHAYEALAGVPVPVAFGKSGGYDAEDPLADWYEAYFTDPLLRLPAGRWLISAGASATIGGDDCGAGPGLPLSASVEIVVEP